MAEDFIELGIEGIDKLVDKHFHKVPDKYVNPHTYSLGKSRRKRHESGGVENSMDNQDEDGVEDDPKDSKRGKEKDLSRGQEDDKYYDDRPRDRDRDSNHSHRSSDLRHTEQLAMDPSYSRGHYDQIPPPTLNQGYPERLRHTDQPYRYSSSRPMQEPEGAYPRDRGYFGQEAASSFAGTRYDEYRAGPPELRRAGLVRRSSSQPGTSRRDDRERQKDDREPDRRPRRRSFSDERKSEKAPENGKTKKVVLTLLGAAVGGLAVSAVMGSMSEKKEHGSFSNRTRHSTGGRSDKNGEGGRR